MDNHVFLFHIYPVICTCGYAMQHVDGDKPGYKSHVRCLNPECPLYRKLFRVEPTVKAVEVPRLVEY